MSTRSLSLAFAALAWVFGSGLARAEERQPETSDEAKQQAKRLFDQAELDYRLGKFDEALRNYQAALKARFFPSILFNIAQCYRNLKNKERALFYYKLFLSDWERVHPGSTPETETEVQGHIARLTTELQAEEAERKRKARDAARRSLPKARTARLRLDGVMMHARILVDGIPRAVAPLAGPLELAPGRRRVEVAADQHLPWSRELEARAGEETTFVVELRPVPKRSRLWLAGTIASTLLAAGAESLAIVYYRRAEDHFRDTSGFADDRRMVVAGHVLAGTFAATAVTSLILYLRSGRRAPDRAAIVAEEASPRGFRF